MYYIYHIPNVKIGCTTNPKKRVKAQGYKEWEILETHKCIDTASKREIELQKEYGLEEKFVAVDYKHQVNNFQSKSPLSKKGRIWKDEWKKKLSQSCMGRKFSEETRDKMRKWSLGRKRPECGNPGESNPKAKLTEKDVIWIRKVYYTNKSYSTPTPKGKYRVKELAEIYNMSTSTIRNVVLRKTWTHI